mmetsp:Transcript_24465/g.53399  ORF Transcript_24465/g.53399 Transcript_24465/m.53399 type:complete len:84 (-) Transcript_24465:286-537(-)
MAYSSQVDTVRAAFSIALLDHVLSLYDAQEKLSCDISGKRARFRFLDFHTLASFHAAMKMCTCPDDWMGKPHEWPAAQSIRSC